MLILQSLISFTFCQCCSRRLRIIYFYPCSYEPELFPGLIYRMVKPRIVLLIFVSGKVVLTGKNIVFNFMTIFIFLNLQFSALKNIHNTAIMASGVDMILLLKGLKFV